MNFANMRCPFPLDGAYMMFGIRAGVKFQLGGVWIGVHYSHFNRRACINIIPCFTVWIAFPGGKTPDECAADHKAIKAMKAMQASS